MIKKSITRRGSGSRVNLLAKFFILLVILVFSTSFANSVPAAGSQQAVQKDTLKGEVVAVDNLHHISMLTLRSDEIGRFPNDRLNIFMNKNTSVKVCNEREPVKDINVSRNATVTYHEVQGLLPVADTVSEKC
ncbi:MAG TPA: hypothetical protein VL122_04450 [Nitrospirota bacterium]|nr:hypothetical protein [Nitrospirota bacterium]